MGQSWGGGLGIIAVRYWLVSGSDRFTLDVSTNSAQDQWCSRLVGTLGLTALLMQWVSSSDIPLV